MRDISNPILHADACDQFEAEILPFIQEEYEQDGIPDIPARSEAWNIQMWSGLLMSLHT